MYVRVFEGLFNIFQYFWSPIVTFVWFLKVDHKVEQSFVFVIARTAFQLGYSILSPCSSKVKEPWSRGRS